MLRFKPILSEAPSHNELTKQSEREERENSLLQIEE